MTRAEPKPTTTDAGIPGAAVMPAAQDGDTQAAKKAAELALDTFALERLAFDIRAWWARNPQLRAEVLSDMASRIDERREGVFRRDS